MPVTPQRKYELLKQVGIDPDKYWIDDSGNVIDLPKDNSAMAGIKTAALNLPRTAAGVGGAALGAAGAGALGLPTGPGAVAAGLAGGFGGAALGSTIGEAIQNAVYPDDVLMAQQARSVRNPGAVQLGDLASHAVFLRPSVSQLRDAGRGIRAFTTIPSFAKMRPAQASALMNVGTGGAIEAGSTMAQGGDLSEILKNAAIGAVFSNPTGVTRAMTGGIFSPHVADQGLRDVVNPADLLAKPGEPVVEKPREVNPELLKAFMKQQKADAKLAEQLAALKANQEAAAKKAQIDAEQGIGFDQPLPAQDFTLPPNLNSVEARFLRSQAVEPDVEITLDPQTKPQPKPPVILEPGTPGALDQELGIRTTQPFFDWWAQNADENYRTRMTQGRPTGEQGQEVAGVTEGTRGPDGKRNITVNKEAYTDTAPHELTHGMILDVLQHGKKGEQAEMRRLLKLAGVDEEAFVQGVGEDVVRRFMAGATTTKTTDAGTTTTTAPGMDDSWRSDFVSFMKYKFGKASPEDVRRIMSNTMLRGGGPKGVSKIVAKPTQEVEEKVIPSSEGAPPVMPETRADRMLPYIEEGKVTSEARPATDTTEVRLNEVDPTLPSNERRALPATPERQQLTFEPLGDVRGTLEQGAEPTNIEGVRESGELTPEERYAAEDAKIRRLEEEAAVLRRHRDFPRAVKQAEGNPAPERGERLPGSERRGREREVKKALRSADLENADLSNVGREEVREATKAEFTNKMKQGRVVSENARESADDLEARRIEARLSGEERPRYQEFGEDRDTVLRRASDNGYTVGPIYHGTRANDISVFRKKESGIWAAFDKQNATPGSGDAPRNVLNLVADPGPRPYTLSPEELGAWRRSLNPLNFVRDIRYKHNATSVKVGDYAIVVFKPEQLKSADSITYDDAGNPIPLEQRFDRESKDVRYQQFGPNSPTDNELPIREWAKDSVLKSDDGELLPLYHGTKTPGFNSFRTEGAEASGYHYGEGAYFTPDPTRASSYAGAKQKVVDYDSDGNAVYGYDNEQAGGVYKVYTNLRNPFETMSDAGVSDIGYKLSMDNPTEYKALASEVAKKNGYTSGSGVGTTEVGNYYLRKQGYDGVVKRRPNGEVVEVVVFDKNNVKSAFGGDARNINPTSGDVRYQQFGPNRPTSGLADPVGRKDFSPFESASQKAARSDNPVIRTVGRALTELFPAQRAMRGKYRALPEAFANLNAKDKDLLYKILIDEYRAGQPAPGTVPARLRKEYNDVRRTLRQMRDDQIKAGQRNSNGVVPGIDDSYFPNVVDPSVRKTLADEIDSPRFKQLKDEFVRFNEANLRSKGATAAKANEEANKLFNRFIGTLNKQPVEGAFDFGAVVLPEGSRLPDNWLHSDPAEAMSQYVRDWSRSRAFHDIVQTNEDVMAGLGQEEFFVNGKKTPVKNRVATPAVKDNNILFLLNEAVGIRRGSQDKITGAIGRAASAAWLANPITRSVDIATSLFKGLGMVTPTQIPGLVSNLRNLGKSYERAHDTGWIREDGNTIVGEVLGAGEAFSNGVDKFSKGLSKYTGSEKLENFGRGLSQNIGEYIARTNTALAQSGNKRATDFLDRVAPNWRTLSEAELGTRIGQLFQGRYDATNLPQWLSDSPAAPFFSLARWNIEQWNNFREFAIKPARNGDPVPLISMLVAGIVGGVGIKEIREALSGRKSKIATLKEIAEAPEGSAKYKELVRYYANLAQLSGTIGIVGEIGNMVLDVASKDSPAAPSMPALEITSDIIPRLIAAGNAMMDGQDPLTVITRMSRDIGNEHVSAYRFLEGMAARTGVSDFAKAELGAANDRRDFRTGKRLRGEPIKAAVQLPINYDNAEERAMEEERDPVKRRQLALELKAKIKQDPDKDSRERKMRAAATSRPSYLPSKENDPKAFREQLDFVRRTQGEDKVTELKKRYLRDKKNSDSQRKMFNR